MKTISPNQFDGSELQRFVAVVKAASDKKEVRWVKVARAKTLRIIINQQDMSFTVAGDRAMLTAEEVYAMFPELKDDVVDAAAPLTQTTPIVDNAGTTSAEATTNATLSN